MAVSEALKVALAAACLFAVASTAATAEPASDKPVVYKTKATGKPLRGVIVYKRRGGYSYKLSDTIPMSSTRRFTEPYSYLQSPGGPFDSGFFFDSAQTPHGGNAPYQQ